MMPPIAPSLETERVSRQKSADGIVVSLPETKAGTRKGGRAFHKLRDGDESDQDEPYPGALWKDSPLE